MKTQRTKLAYMVCTKINTIRYMNDISAFLLKKSFGAMSREGISL